MATHPQRRMLKILGIRSGNNNLEIDVNVRKNLLLFIADNLWENIHELYIKVHATKLFSPNNQGCKDLSQYNFKEKIPVHDLKKKKIDAI